LSTRGLKTNIAVNVVAILVVAMILIDFIVIITFQRILVRSEAVRGDLILSAVEEVFGNSTENGIPRPAWEDSLGRLVDDSGCAAAVVMDGHGALKYMKDSETRLKNELQLLIGEAIRTRSPMTRFFGSTWGVFGPRKKFLAKARPFKDKRGDQAGIGIILRLDSVYRTLRHTQNILIIYAVINTIILTFFGIYRLSRSTVKPVQRLVKRAEEYEESDELFFMLEKEENNEFNRLSKSLNRMLTRIAEDKEKLKNTVVSLEKANYDLKKAQNEIIRAEKLASVGRLSSGIAHEIGNPIGIITGYLDLLKKSDTSDVEKKEFLRRTENELDRINDIIKQLLNFSRPSAEGMQVISAHALIRDVAEMLKLQPMMSDIELNLLLTAEYDKIRVDQGQLRQVFLNLAINAVDAMHTTGAYCELEMASETVRSDNHGTNMELQISFTDNGMGISEKNLSYIFDHFYTTKEPGKGTGLGLSVSFMIIEGFGGKITAESKEGEGTTVRIFLPLYQEKETDDTRERSDGE